jgi:hypothetical protein
LIQYNQRAGEWIAEVIRHNPELARFFTTGGEYFVGRIRVERGPSVHVQAA